MDNFYRAQFEIWDGPVVDDNTYDEAYETYRENPVAKNAFLFLLESFKRGDFSQKDRLIWMMNTCKDKDVQAAAIRVFCSISSHEDLHDPANLAFLEDAKEDQVFTFVVNSAFTLSYEVLPYLLVLREEWQGTYIEEIIRPSLDMLTNYSKDLAYDSPWEELEEYLYNKLQNIDQNIYYFAGQPFYPAPLAKCTVNQAHSLLKDFGSFNNKIETRILSQASGLEFPIIDGEMVTEDKVRDLHDYIEKLVKFPWEEGKKYYYGHRI